MLGLAGSGYKYGTAFHKSAIESKTAFEKARLDVEMADIALSSVDGLATSAAVSAPKMMDMALANGLAAIMASAEKNGVKVDSIASAGTQNQKGQTVASMYSNVPLTAGMLRKVEIVIKASYKDMDGFRGFFADLQAANVSTQKLDVNKVNFVTTLRLFGV